tara:strand:- start:1267 stop:2316 length:1050 start_codon:yes stop_codon:yes gene_type:complete
MNSLKINRNLKKSIIRFLFIITLLISFAYSTTYQQYRHLDASNPRGIIDSSSYIKMSNGDYGVAVHHRYRFIVPQTVSLIKPLVKKINLDATQTDILSFYIVNFTLIVISSYLLYSFILELGLPSLAGIIGAFIFLGSRISIISAATPLVDSMAIFSTIYILYITLIKKHWLMVLSLPILALTKDTSYILILIPLLSKEFRSIFYYISLSISFSLVYYSRLIIDNLPSALLFDSSDISETYLKTVIAHVNNIRGGLMHLVSLSGLHDIQNGYSLILVFAILGYFVNRKHKIITLSKQMLIIIPIGFFYAILSGNLGRLFFSVSFPTVIALAVTFIIWMQQKFWGLQKYK